MKYSLLFLLVLTLSVCVRLNLRNKGTRMKKHKIQNQKRAVFVQTSEDNIATLDSENCPDSDKPFYCLVDGEYTCVGSQIDCDCPNGYIKCDYMKYCVPEDRTDMCPSYIMTKKRCEKLNSAYTLFADGICRNKNTGRLPNQRVCPVGYVLCPDLSCRKTHAECMKSDECDKNENRCADQSCQPYSSYCPSTVTCEDPRDVVCPGSKCVKNEMYCPDLIECDIELPYLCGNSPYQTCSLDYDNCPTSISCYHGLQLCEDLICRPECK